MFSPYRSPTHSTLGVGSLVPFLQDSRGFAAEGDDLPLVLPLRFSSLWNSNRHLFNLASNRFSCGINGGKCWVTISHTTPGSTSK